MRPFTCINVDEVAEQAAAFSALEVGWYAFVGLARHKPVKETNVFETNKHNSS